MYIYESHLGGLFVTEEELDFEACYCEQCGDCDRLMGSADNAEEAWQLLKPLCVGTEETMDIERAEYGEDGWYAWTPLDMIQAIPSEVAVFNEFIKRI